MKMVSSILLINDEWYALVRALELVESSSGSVTTITVGRSSDDSTIKGKH